MTADESYQANTYGDRIADVYDALYAPDGALAGTVSEPTTIAGCLFELAAGGPVLELGIGTGRIALPLAARGIPVQGIDASQAMVDRLKAKPGAERIEVTIGDFADVPVEGEFPLIFVAFNTFFALLTQADQRRCLENIARRLAPGGVFAMEAFVPDLSRYDRGQRVQIVGLGLREVRLDASSHDPVQQRVTAQQVSITEEGIRMYPVRLRYAWPSELDLMAELAGLRLQARWGGWDRSSFTAASGRHVSIYEKP